MGQCDHYIMLNQTLSTFWGLCKYFIYALLTIYTEFIHILFGVGGVELISQETYILVKTMISSCLIKKSTLFVSFVNKILLLTKLMKNLVEFKY